MTTTTPGIGTSYDEVPYHSVAHADTTPDRLACLARLFGMTPEDPARCRYLEIGCASGGNLAPLALCFPEAEFVGVDLSRRQVEDGLRMFAELGIENVRLLHLDLMDIDESLGDFDFIAAHGVYSWVPEAVQERLLAVCRECLRPQGVAYVSYNTYPGWHMREMVREMMMFHTARLPDPAMKVGQARALLDFLAKAASLSKNAYSILLQSEVETLRDLPDSYLFHDHLAKLNAPVYFHQFIARATAAQLQYLGEATFAAMLPMHFPVYVQEAFSKVTGDILQVEQYMDFVRNRTFRQTLLVHSEVELDRVLDWQSMTPFRFRSKARAVEGGGDVRSDEKVVYQFEDWTVATRVPLLKAAMAELVEIYPVALSFEALRDRARASIGEQRDDDDQVLGGNLLSCFANGVVEVTLVDLPFTTTVSERPVAFPMARWQVMNKVPRLTNVRHESGDADQILRQVIFLADGTRRREEIAAALVESVLASGLKVSRRDDGRPIESPEELHRVLSGVADDALQKAANLAFLVA
ncbi:MAG: methyltransferase regulatory domain-containing protein [Deltaproteobacteria bacterium]|nr:methyltransferase regulatory domain-containing protein [Deltaproteobacteria bacterium]